MRPSPRNEVIVMACATRRRSGESYDRLKTKARALYPRFTLALDIDQETVVEIIMSPFDFPAEFRAAATCAKPQRRAEGTARAGSC